MNSASIDPLSSFNLGHGPLAPDEDIMVHGRSPKELYTSPEHHAREVSEVFEKSWVNVGRVNEFPENGSFVVRELLGRSILIIRGRDAKVRAFYNACSHRLAKLVWESEGKLSAITCPYHAWGYDTQGALKFIANKPCFPDVDQAESGLTGIACESYGNFVFINLDPNHTISLRDYLGGWGERMEGLPWDDFPVSGRASATLPFNWKLGIENTSESYHAFALHKRTLGSVVPPDNRYCNTPSIEYYGPHTSYVVVVNTEPNFDESNMMQAFLRANVGMLLAGGAEAKFEGERPTFATHPGVNQKRLPNFGVDNNLIFPNLVLGLSSFGWYTQRFWPITADTCFWQAEWGMTKPKTWRDRYAQEQVITSYRDIIGEDVPNMVYQHDMLKSGAKPYQQFGTEEMMLRRLAACIASASNENAMPAQAAPLAAE